MIELTGPCLAAAAMLPPGFPLSPHAHIIFTRIDNEVSAAGSRTRGGTKLAMEDALQIRRRGRPKVYPDLAAAERARAALRDASLLQSMS